MTKGLQALERIKKHNEKYYYSLIDKDRSATGDFYKKPTQYFFVNREPSNNFIFEGVDIKKKKRVMFKNKVERSMISKDYANRFIREYILKEVKE